MAEATDSSEYRYSSVQNSVVKVGPRHFKIRGPLGKGGFSNVYAGADSQTGKSVTLKMMFVVEEDKTTYKQTCSEIKTMRKLEHENLIKLLGYDLHAEYRDRKCVILVQEFAPKRSLFEYLLHSRSPFNEQMVMYIGHQIFQGVQFMHNKGIAHRDLKPENIVLDRDFRLKIIDFGFAKFFRKNDRAIKMRTSLGTRGYMAPEISARSHIPRAYRQSYDEKVDIFALGVIMFICFAGFPPFRQTNNEDWWFDKIIKKEWNYFWKAHERKGKFSKQAKNLLQKMLAAKPEDRFNINECLNCDFFVNNENVDMVEQKAYTDEMRKRYEYVKLKLTEKREREIEEQKPHADHYNRRNGTETVTNLYGELEWIHGRELLTLIFSFLIHPNKRDPARITNTSRIKDITARIKVVRDHVKDHGHESSKYTRVVPKYTRNTGG